MKLLKEESKYEEELTIMAEVQAYYRVAYKVPSFLHTALYSNWELTANYASESLTLSLGLLTMTSCVALRKIS